MAIKVYGCNHVVIEVDDVGMAIATNTLDRSELTHFLWMNG
jgi:hypothetical protein